MFLLVVILALVNLGLGFVTADFLSRDGRILSRRGGRVIPPSRPAVQLQYPAAFTSVVEPHAPPIEAAVQPLDPPAPQVDGPVEAIAVIESTTIEAQEEISLPSPEIIEVRVRTFAPAAQDIPAAWLAILEGMAPVNSLVEASIEVLKLRVGAYRESVLQTDAQIRAAGDDRGHVLNCHSALAAVNQRWLAQQDEAAGHLADRQAALGEHSAIGQSLLELLGRQRSQIQESCERIGRLSRAYDPIEGRVPLLREIGGLLDLAHAMRDRMHESSLEMLRHGDRLAAVDGPSTLDPATGLLNRVGVEALFSQWWQNDPGRQRHLSLALLDIDGFREFNMWHGWPAGDRILRGMAVTMDSTLRKNRGFDRLGRYSGERFLLFLGDTGPHGATSAVERLRQTLAATAFQREGAELHVTVSCAVTEALAGDQTADIFRRLEEGLRLARRQGPDRTALDEGSGPKLVTPPTFEVRSRVVRLQDE